MLAATVALGPSCAALERPARFPGARRAVTEARLSGPFDGVVVDAATDEPLAEVTVLGIWSFDEGDGLSAPAGSVVVRTKTDAAGRFRVPALPETRRGPAVRLSRFTLVAYRRGYVAYRSDTDPTGRRRTDFTNRQARISLEKWREQDRHDRHLAYLAPASVLESDLAWSRDEANRSLWVGSTPTAPERPAGGATAPTRPKPSQQPRVLDASAVLPPEEVALRTGFVGTFRVADLEDLPPTDFYHGVHLEAVDHDESWDVAVRVWRDPPGGLDAIRPTIEATLPGAPLTDDVTDTTWVYETDDVRAVGFLDPDRNVAVLLSCGAHLCGDTATAVVLARLVHERLDALTTRPAPATGGDDEPRRAGDAPASTERAPETGPAETAEDTGDGAASSEHTAGTTAEATAPEPAGTTDAPGTKGKDR